MATNTGGDITEVTWNHPTLGSGILYPKAGEDSEYDTGGLRNDDDDNAVDGAGQSINKKTRVRAYFSVTAAWDANVDKTLEAMVALAGSPVEADWTITCGGNGTVYALKGVPVGDLRGNMNSATFPLKVSGGGIMKKIV